jgi:hypothetical protein
LIRLAQHVDRHERRREERNEHVNDARDRDADEEGARKVALGVLRLLDHVDRVLEADDREERERRAADHERERISVCVELEGAGRLADALAQCPDADRDNDEKAQELDARQYYVDLHGLHDAAKIDPREPHYEQRHEHDERHDQELLEIARERAARCGHRGQCRAHHGEADEERDEPAVERALRVQRGTGGRRVFADELEVRRGRQHRDEEGAAEREPRGPADAAGNIARQRIDAGAEHVADHEK